MVDVTPSCNMPLWRLQAGEVDGRRDNLDDCSLAVLGSQRQSTSAFGEGE